MPAFYLLFLTGIAILIALIWYAIFVIDKFSQKIDRQQKEIEEMNEKMEGKHYE